MSGRCPWEGERNEAVGAGMRQVAPKGRTMHDRELSRADMEDIQRDLDQLIRLGLVEVDENGGLALTDAGAEALHRANAQTWN